MAVRIDAHMRCKNKLCKKEFVKNYSHSWPNSFNARPKDFFVCPYCGFKTLEEMPPNFIPIFKERGV